MSKQLSNDAIFTVLQTLEKTIPAVTTYYRNNQSNINNNIFYQDLVMCYQSLTREIDRAELYQIMLHQE